MRTPQSDDTNVSPSETVTSETAPALPTTVPPAGTRDVGKSAPPTDSNATALSVEDNQAPAGNRAAPAGGSASRHLSETVKMHQWLCLLVITATSLLLLLAVAVMVRLLSYIDHTLLLFALGGLLAYAFDPMVERIRRRTDGRRHPRWVGVVTVFAVLFGFLALGIAALSAELSVQVHHLIREREPIEQRAHQMLADTDNWLAARNIRVNLEEYLNHPPPSIKNWGEATSRGALRTLGNITRSTVESLIILLITLYFLIYCHEMREGVNRGLPERLRPYAEAWQDDVNRILGGFVRGQAVLALTMGAMAGIACMLLGVKFWLLIGLFVVFASLIPVFGPYIGAVPAVIAAALTPGGHVLTPLLRAILVLLLFIILNEVGSKILYPRLVGAALGLHEVLVLFVLFAGLEIGGIWGVLFAAPLTALTTVTLVHLYRLWQGEPPISIAQAAHKGGAEARAQGTP